MFGRKDKKFSVSKDKIKILMFGRIRYNSNVWKDKMRYEF